MTQTAMNQTATPITDAALILRLNEYNIVDRGFWSLAQFKIKYGELADVSRHLERDRAELIAALDGCVSASKSSDRNELNAALRDARATLARVKGET